ncbi:MerR family transcriptional regulator [Tistlia consotensis]|uniref:MerR family transcriptional regulator n=1 Tax=Tistlia consotensis TaxID=1321365 RepID=UPI00190E97E7|nr:MerR family transcriptional regulator [Tistlia consotensis]
MSQSVRAAAASRQNGKSAGAFRTISEVSEELDVPQHVLRFWETKFAQVRPLKRGGGRRYYRPEDIELLRRIRQLLYGEGYTIKGVQKLLREGGARPQETAEVEPEIVKDTNKLQSILDDLIEIRNLLRNG